MEWMAISGYRLPPQLQQKQQQQQQGGQQDGMAKPSGATGSLMGGPHPHQDMCNMGQHQQQPQQQQQQSASNMLDMWAASQAIKTEPQQVVATAANPAAAHLAAAACAAAAAAAANNQASGAAAAAAAAAASMSGGSSSSNVNNDRSSGISTPGSIKGKPDSFNLVLLLSLCMIRHDYNKCVWKMCSGGKLPGVKIIWITSWISDHNFNFKDKDSLEIEVCNT